MGLDIGFIKGSEFSDLAQVRRVPLRGDGGEDETTPDCDQICYVGAFESVGRTGNFLIRFSGA